MAVKVVMPKFGLTMTEGTIVKWFKKEGEKVIKGEPLLEVTTDKITNEVEAPADGILRKILANPGDKVKVSELIAVIAEAEENINDLLSEEVKELEGSKEPVTLEKKKIKVSPVAKKMALEAGVNIENIKGTGPGGRITKEDVLNFINKQNKKTCSETVEEIIEEPLTGIRQVIAERMSQSWQNAPHVTLCREVDVSELKQFKDKLKKEDLKISYTDIITVLTAKALKQYPEVNASLVENKIIKHPYINIGIAVSLDGGLIVPVIKDVDKLGVFEISKVIKELALKARNNTLESTEVTKGTFTITNLGMYGVDMFTPIINPPESAILGIGRINDRPILLEDKVINKPMMWLSLSFDHRVIDGALAAKFLGKIAYLIENPAMALL